jgi:hypothetical protein
MTSGGAQRTRYYTTRPRRVPPEFCSDELLEACSILAALLLYRLISQADDQGRLPGAPKYVRAACLGMRPEITERKVAVALDELVRAGFVLRYEVAGRALLQIGRWFDLQGKWGQRRTYPSRYPAPPGWTSDWVSSGEPDGQVPAHGGLGVRNVRPPSPSSSASSTPSPRPGAGATPARTTGPERVAEIIGRARRGLLTGEEAFELGASLVDALPVSSEHPVKSRPVGRPVGPSRPRGIAS